jgi:hypothetical protein
MKSLKTIINEAKEMPQKVAMAILQVKKDEKSYEGALTMNNAGRDKVKEISGEKKLTKDVPGPTTPNSAELDLGLLIAIALNQSTMKQGWSGGGDWLDPINQPGKPKFKNAAGKKTFGQLAKSAGVKL